MKCDRGMTLIEVIVVILLISTVTAVILTRAMDIPSVGATAVQETVRVHLRYAQAMAMKQNKFMWGIKCDGTDYWLFRTDDDTDPAEPDNNLLVLPGEDEAKLSAAGMSAFTVYFDGYGRPRQYSSGDGKTVPITGTLTLSIEAETIQITPETGFVS